MLRVAGRISLARAPRQSANFAPQTAEPFTWAGFYVRGAGDMEFGDDKTRETLLGDLTGARKGDGFAVGRWSRTGEWATVVASNHMQWTNPSAAALTNCTLGCRI